MLSWIAKSLQKANQQLGLPNDISRLMKTGLDFEPVLTSTREEEYRVCLMRICRATFNIEGRNIVMDCLHYAFAPKNPANEWRTIFNGLRILNSLIDSGSVQIFKEVSEGKHFDLLQKSLFLVTFSHSDERISKLIRTAARQIRDKLLNKLNEIEQYSGDDCPPPISSSGISSEDPPVAFEKSISNSVSQLVSLRHVESDDDECPSPESRKSLTVETPQLLDLL